MSTPLTIYLKNMAGDVIPLFINSSWQDTDLLAHLACEERERGERDNRGVMRLLRSPGVFEEGEVVSLWIDDGVYVTQNLVQGKMRTRFVLPIRRADGCFVEFYVAREIMGPQYNTVWYVEIHEGGYQQGKKGNFGAIHNVLYDALCQAGYPPSPSIIHTLYTLIDEHLPMTEEIDGKIHAYRYTYNVEEPIECGCGEVVLRRRLAEHQTTHVEN